MLVVTQKKDEKKGTLNIKTETKGKNPRYEASLLNFLVEFRYYTKFEDKLALVLRYFKDYDELNANLTEKSVTREDLHLQYAKNYFESLDLFEEAVKIGFVPRIVLEKLGLLSDYAKTHGRRFLNNDLIEEESMTFFKMKRTLKGLHKANYVPNKLVLYRFKGGLNNLIAFEEFIQKLNLERTERWFLERRITEVYQIAGNKNEALGILGAIKSLDQDYQEGILLREIDLTSIETKAKRILKLTTKLKQKNGKVTPLNGEEAFSEFSIPKVNYFTKNTPFLTYLWEFNLCSSVGK